MGVSSRILGAASLVAAAFAPAAPAAGQQQAKRTVDLELVLAVDVSQSMDYDEHELQKNGYVEAFRHKDVINALMSGPEGRIAVTYMEWGGDFAPEILIPWTIIDSDAMLRGPSLTGWRRNRSTACSGRRFQMRSTAPQN